ncbi:MAG: hypothetical protein LBS40_08750 [Burkholderiales bacterium]|nr:hypothetical protein [Burkholderiales bacterium]
MCVVSRCRACFLGFRGHKSEIAGKLPKGSEDDFHREHLSNLPLKERDNGFGNAKR